MLSEQAIWNRVYDQDANTLSIPLYPKAGLVFKSGSFSTDNTMILDASGSREGALGGACYEMADGGEYVDFGDVFNFDASTSYTITGWFKAPVSTDWGTLYNKSVNVGGSAGFRILLRSDQQAGYLSVELEDDSAHEVTITHGNETGYNMSDNRWHFIVVIIDRDSAIMKISVDDSDYESASISTVGDASNAIITKIGAYTATRAPICRVQDWRVYQGKILTDDERFKVYSGKVLGDESAHWWMTEGTGTYCLDSSGNDVHGTMNNWDSTNFADDGVYDNRDLHGYSKSYVIEDMQDASSSETIWDKGTAGTQTDDTSDFIIGTKSFKLTTDGDGVRMQTRKDSASYDLSGKYLKIWIKCDDVQKIDGFRLWFTSNSWTGYAYWALTSLSQGDTYTRDDTWTCITLMQSQATVSGSIDWSSINGVQITLEDDGTGAINGWVGGIFAIPEYSEPIISFTFDDGPISQYTEGLSYLSTKNFPATAYIISDYVDEEEPNYMSLEQLHELESDYGWDIACHGNINLSTLTYEEAETEMLRMKAWLTSKGFTRGVNHMALPQGGWNETIKPLMDEHFDTVRTIYTQKLETLPASDYSKLRPIYLTNATSVATIKSKIDAVVASNGWGILVFHKLVESPSISTEYAIADFQEIVDYVESLNVSVKTVSEAYNLVSQTVRDSYDAVYYLNDDDTGVIDYGIYIPSLANGANCAAYLAGGSRANLGTVGKARYNVALENSNCVTGDGVDSYASFGEGYDDVVTISCRFKTTDTTSSYLRVMTNKDSDDDANYWNICIRNGELVCAYHRTAGYLNNVAVAVNDGEEHLVIFDKSTKKVYLDGSEVSMTDNGSGSFTSGSTASLFAIDSGATAFLGSGWDFRAWNKSLSSDERTTVLNGGSVTDELVFHIPCSEGAGTMLHDVSGNENHAYMYNFTLSSAWGTKQNSYHYNLQKGFTGGIYFDGSNDYVDLGANFTSAKWVACRMYSTDTTANHRLVTSGGAASSNDWTLQLSSAKLVLAQDDSGTNNALITTNSFNDGKWYDVVADIENLKIYVNGVEESGTVGNSVYSVAGNGKIGAKEAGSFLFLGGIKDVVISNTSLTSQDITDYSNGIISSSAIRYFKLDSLSGTTAIDEISGNNGTIVGTPDRYRLPVDNNGLILGISDPVYPVVTGGHNNAETTFNFNPNDLAVFNRIELDTANLLTNGNFTSWTGDDPNNWTVSESGTSYIDQSPTGQLHLVSDASGNNVSVRQSGVASANKTFSMKISCTADNSTGNSAMGDGGSTNNQVTMSTTAGYEINFVTTSADVIIKRYNASTDMSFDNCSLYEITPQKYSFDNDVDDNATMFKRSTSSKNDRFLIYAVPLTGDDLTKAQTYVGL